MNLDTILGRMEKVRDGISKAHEELLALDSVILEDLSKDLGDLEFELDGVMDNVIEIQDALNDVENSISNIKW